MVPDLRFWWIWAVAFLCACSAAVPPLPVQQPQAVGLAPTVLVIRPGGYKPVDLTREEFKQGMRMLYANGPLPGAPKGGKPQFILASADPSQMVKAEGYLQWCQHITGRRFDCWDDLNASGGLDGEGSTYVALHFALGEALEDAATAVGSMTPMQVRAMMSLMFLGMIVELLSPEPVTKILFMVSMTNLIAFVGVDFFNQVVKGFTPMLDDLERAHDFGAVRAAGVRYGQRIGPTVARIVVMVATYGIAKFAGLFKGSMLDLPGGSRAAALAEQQGFRLPGVEGARSATMTADGALVIDLGSTAVTTSAAANVTSRPRGPAAVVPGRVQSRINIRNGSDEEGEGWSHVVDRHFDSTKNASRFTVSQAELRAILQSEEVVRSPIMRVLENARGPRYLREVDLHRQIGLDKFDGFRPTSILTVITDEFGNMVTATPGRLQ